jgi:glucan-binding YG repeat protein
MKWFFGFTPKTPPTDVWIWANGTWILLDKQGQERTVAVVDGKINQDLGGE